MSVGAEESATAEMPSTVQQVEQALAGATKILTAYGFDTAAAVASQKAHAPLQPRTVVVVGEVKRGKSSLVNALLGCRDASPVGVDVTTSATVSFVAESERFPPGSAELVFPGHTEKVLGARLPDWVTADGRHVQDPARDALPTRAIVGVESDFLRGGTVVVDTPGTGGLEAVHGQLALVSAREAGVLVVVCDASTPLTAPEMEFVRDAAATTESVIVAVSKTDKHLRGWKLIVEENQHLIQQHLRRTIPVVGVSSVRASAAAELPVSDPRRARIEQQCGIFELRSLITERLADRQHGPSVDALRTAIEGLRKVQAKIGVDIDVTSGSAAVLPELTAHRDRLQQLKDQSAQWEHYLARDLTLARQQALSHLEEQLDEIKTRWTVSINSSGMAVLRKSPQVFTAQIEADLLAAMTSTVTVFLDALAAIVLPLFESEAIWYQIRADIVASMQSAPLATGEVASKRQGLLDPSVLTMGMIGTSMLGALIGVGAVAGVVWVGVNLGYKAMRAGKTNLLSWLRETLAAAKSSTSRMLEAALALSRPEIVLRYREHVRSSIETVQQQITDARESATLEKATRDATLKRLQNNLRVTTAKISELDNLITRLNVPPQPVKVT
ncbi:MULTISPECIES: dynamin family protein [unclassified Rhodococcus (in: high G+C Gram-positive bacteria)]|uniref:dynamin family protein n=1 Tax=unclassified Rhodococcus (in: high G+C Gram-positive bacteria) TaxID=192944 RepID=UPI00339217F1